MYPRLAVLTLSALCSAAITSCGGSDDLPKRAVARVDGTTLQRPAFERWLTVAAKRAGDAGAVFDPPRFRRCAAAAGRALRERAGSAAAVPRSGQRRALCERSYRRFRARVMRAVVGASWVRGEARARGIRVTATEVRRRMNLARRGRRAVLQGPRGVGLAWSGLFAADDPFWVRMTLLAEKLRAQVLRGAGRPSRAEIARYYRTHRARYAQPERRDVLVVEAANRADAEAARKALEGGEPFAAVARRWSIDRTTNRRGGRLLGVRRGLRGPNFDRAVFSARKGEIVGPVRTPLGFGVFKLRAIHPPYRRTLAQAMPSIRRLLTAQHRAQAWARFLRDFSRRWRERTECSQGLKVPSCKNG